MKVALCIWFLLATARANEEDGSEPEAYTENNPLNLKEGKAFFSDYGRIFDLYSTDKEIRNLLVPPSEYLSTFNFYNPDPKKHPPVFFNLYKNGQNDGVYMLKEQTARKIKDGSDTTANYPTDSIELQDAIVYISASNGIYTYNPKDDVITKFGTITDNFKAIDKMWNKDELYALADDNKIYNITAQGTVKTKVEGVNYAKDFVIDLLGAIYFIGEDNKPQVLYRGSKSSIKINGLNFDTTKAFLSRPLWDLYSVNYTDHLVPLAIEGVYYFLLNSGVLAAPCNSMVSGLTAFSVDYNFVHFYGAKGRIYMHTMLADNPQFTQKTGSSKDFRNVAFSKNVRADLNQFGGSFGAKKKH